MYSSNGSKKQRYAVTCKMVEESDEDNRGDDYVVLGPEFEFYVQKYLAHVTKVKSEFLDEYNRRAVVKQPSLLKLKSNDWYLQCALRAVNQAIGIHTYTTIYLSIQIV